MCCPPAPLALNVSIFSSVGSIFTSTSSASGKTATVTVESLVFIPEFVEGKRIQQAGSSAWPGAIQPLQMSTSASYDAYVDTDPEDSKHNKIATADGYSVIIIPSGTQRMKLKVNGRTGFVASVRFASTVDTATSGSTYAGFVSSLQLVDRDSHGYVITSEIPSGANCFGGEVDHNSNNNGVEITFYNSAT